MDLRDWRGYLIVDDYAGCKALLRTGPNEFACLACIALTEGGTAGRLRINILNRQTLYRIAFGKRGQLVASGACIDGNGIAPIATTCVVDTRDSKFSKATFLVSFRWH